MANRTDLGTVLRGVAAALGARSKAGVVAAALATALDVHLDAAALKQALSTQRPAKGATGPVDQGRAELSGLVDAFAPLLRGATVAEMHALLAATAGHTTASLRAVSRPAKPAPRKPSRAGGKTRKTSATPPMSEAEIDALFEVLRTGDTSAQRDALARLKAGRVTGQALVAFKARAADLTGVSSAAKSKPKALAQIERRIDGIARARGTTPSA